MKTWQRNTLVFILIVFFDQLTKSLAASGEILFHTRLLSFNFVKNTGASFGILQGTTQILVWVSVIFLGLIMFYYHNLQESNRFPLIIISAGIVGNFIDRVILGYVIDFIDLHFWPVFNIADSAIVIGVIWLLILEIREEL